MPLLRVYLNNKPLDFSKHEKPEHDTTLKHIYHVPRGASWQVEYDEKPGELIIYSSEAIKAFEEGRKRDDRSD